MPNFYSSLLTVGLEFEFGSTLGAAFEDAQEPFVQIKFFADAKPALMAAGINKIKDARIVKATFAVFFTQQSES